jgi:MSHA type pilus biogenesis protein MshL
MTSRPRRSTRALALCAAVAVLLSGCAHGPAPRQAAAPELPTPLAPLVVADALSSGAASATPARGPRGGSFRFRDTSVRDAIRLLFKGSDLNVLVDDDVKGRITADFAGATPEQVLSAVLRSQGLSMTYEEGYARIGLHDRRIFHLDYVAGAAYGALWDEIATQVQALLTPQGKVTVSPATGTLIVADRPENLDQVESHLRHLEEVIGRQVLIEAKVIEVTLNDSFQMGVNYGLFPRALGIGPGVGGAATGGNALLQSFAPNVGGIQFGLFRTGDFSALLEALHAQGQVNMLSSPRVATLNNQPAVIHVTEQVPVISREVLSGEIDPTQTAVRYDVTFEEAGIRLEVTPQIGGDGGLTIRVHPRVTEVSGEVTTPDNLQTLPILNERETETVLKVRDGQSIVLGGFIQKRRTEDVSKVPGLGSLPLIGALFRSTDQKEDRVELLILLTPTVLDTQRIAQGVRDGMEGLTDVARPFHFGILHGRGFDLVPPVSPSGFAPVTVPPASAPGILPGGFSPVTRLGLARHHLTAGMAFAREGDGDRAEQEWIKAVRLDPDLSEARFQLALLYAQRAQTTRALKYWSELARQRPAHPQGINRIALAFTASGAFDPAIRVLKQGVEYFPRNAGLITNLGVAYLGAGEPELAEAAFMEAARVDPGAVEAVVDRAEILLSRGGLEAARMLYVSVLPHISERDPEFVMKVRRRIAAIDRLLAGPGDGTGTDATPAMAPPRPPAETPPAPPPQPTAGVSPGSGDAA